MMETPEDMSQHASHLDRMRDYYRRTAVEYSSAHGGDAGDSHNFATHQVLEILKTHGWKSLLDVCCGPGRCIAAALTAGHDAHGIDICQDLLDVGVREFGLPAERMHCGDATRLPFPDKSFDVSCVLGALHHSAIPLSIVSEMIRVTRHAIVVSDEANHLHGSVRAILKGLGIFDPVYRLIFRREPRTTRRAIETDGDGPTFDFTIEEIVPLLREHFTELHSTSFVRIGKTQLRPPLWPRFFATQAVVAAVGAKHG